MKQQKLSPTFAGIESHVHRAHVERATFIAEALSQGIVSVTRLIQHAGAGLFGRAPAAHSPRPLAAR